MQTNYVCQCPCKSQENHAWQMYIILLEITDKTSEKLNLQIPKGPTHIVWVICPVSPDMVTANNWASASLMVIWATKTLLMWDQLLPRLAYDWQRVEDRFGVLGRMIEPEDHWYYCWYHLLKVNTQIITTQEKSFMSENDLVYFWTVELHPVLSIVKNIFHNFTTGIS